MATNSPDAELDELMTEAVADNEMMLDELSVAELVTLMNNRDARIPGAVRDALPTIIEAIDATSERMRAGGRLIYVGAGTSGRLGVLDASEIPPTFGTDGDVVLGIIAGGPTALVSSIESAEDSEETGRSDLEQVDPGPLDTIVGIASSGRTPYVLGALRLGNQRGSLTVGLSCNLDAPISEVAQHGIEIAVGPEVVTGSTRLGAGTATKLVLNMFSTISMIKLGKTYKTLMVDVKATNAKLVRRAVRIVTLATGVDDAAARTALDAADWNAKLAIATVVTGMSVDDARTALSAAAGVLRTVVETAPRAGQL
ncbi:N-acetylmuramic acid 6-phosphate etherase [Leifsonia shinshuensis]|uniref:N-acetylmuramic acid 6-phosphate etherase n=1 Tax=Leifsonia shinshuensis TaxID=150026 RepID=A0A7G6YBF8_9MICO|nr:N-acetylmuramic acid 6-phosphate etherase [Leifsonia shinshuensis]QNE35823.1 N-acetylmuramic acid 6-phosphate etherase [Leifsonia shinshuensis]